MGEKERNLSLNALMDALGSAHPGSAARPPLEAEYERRKFFWQRIAVVIAGIGLVIATVGVVVAAIHVF
jgi:hypothetical protein